jgi:hypothetical protein
VKLLNANLGEAAGGLWGSGVGYLPCNELSTAHPQAVPRNAKIRQSFAEDYWLP